MEYSTITPTHNEAKNIPILVKGIHDVLKKTGKKFEIIILNDNSTDNSWQLLQELKKKVKELKPINRTEKPGVGYTVREGLRNAKGKYIITLDGDLSHDPKEIPKFISKIPECDMVCGSRYIHGGRANMSLNRKVISGSFNIFFRKLIGIKVKDFTSGFRMYRRKVVNKIRLKSKGYGIFIEIPIKAHLNGFKLKETPIHYHKRLAGESGLNYLNQGPEYFVVVLDVLRSKLRRALK